MKFNRFNFGKQVVTQFVLFEFKPIGSIIFFYLTKDKPLPKYYDTISQDEMIDLLLYRIKKEEEYTETLRERIKEYQSIFDCISKFTNKGQTIYR